MKTKIKASNVAEEYSIRKLMSKSAREPTEIDTIIIHVHGGAFVATSSYSHQVYTRLWANQLPSAAIFSIDYRLAPDHRFPA